MAEFKPFNLGNVLMQAESIQSARDRRDPNSPENRLRSLQIQQAEQNLSKVDPDALKKEAEAGYMIFSRMAQDPSYIPRGVEEGKRVGLFDANFSVEGRNIMELQQTAGERAREFGEMLSGLQRANNPEKGFTLAPGARRYDPSGNVVAEAPARSKLLSPEELAQRKDIAEAGTEARANAKLAEQRGKRLSSAAGKGAQTAFISEQIDTALEQANGFTTGFPGAVGANVPGSPAHNLSNTLDTIRANIGFDKLQEMRDNSPTGGALGQVSDQENRLLQSVWGSVQQSQSEAQLKRNLRRLKFQLARSWKRVAEAYKRDYGTELPQDFAPGADIIGTVQTPSGPMNVTLADLEQAARDNTMSVEDVQKLMGFAPR